MKTTIEKRADAIMNLFAHAILNADTWQEVQEESGNGIRALRDLKFDHEVLALDMDTYKSIITYIDMGIDCLKEARWTWAVAQFREKED